MSRLMIGYLCAMSENVARWNREQFIHQKIDNKSFNFDVRYV